MTDENTLPPFYSTGIEIALIKLGAAMFSQVTEIAIGQHRREWPDRGFEEFRLSLFYRSAKLALDAAGPVTELDRAAESRIENGAIDKHFTYGYDRHAQNRI